MNYIINGIVNFDPEHAVLKNIQTGDEVILPLPAARLLQFIVASESEILTRELLIKEVWDNFGLQSSNNNLNNYLSLVRRTLMNLGCENIIQTIPKVGIRLSMDAIIDISIEAQTMPVSVIKKRQGLKINQKIIFLPMIIVVLFLVFFIFYIDRSGINNFSIQKPYIFKGCKIELLSEKDDAEKKAVSELILSDLSRLGYSCGKESVIFFDSTEKSDNNYFNRYFLSICNDVNEGLRDCNSYNLLQ